LTNSALYWAADFSLNLMAFRLRPKSGSCSRTDKGVAHGAVMAAVNPAIDSFRTVQWHCLREEITASSYKVWQCTAEGLLHGMQIIDLLKEQQFF